MTEIPSITFTLSQDSKEAVLRLNFPASTTAEQAQGLLVILVALQQGRMTRLVGKCLAEEYRKTNNDLIRQVIDQMRDLDDNQPLVCPTDAFQGEGD